MLLWFSFIIKFLSAAVPPPEKKIEKPIERKRPTKLHVDLEDKETCSDKQRYD